MKTQILIENHSKDCRWKIPENPNVSQTLASAMGMGGVMYR